MTYALVRANPAFTVPNNVNKVVEFLTEEHDPMGFYDPAFPTIFTVPSGVTKVRLVAQLDLTNANVDLATALHIRKNGAFTIDGMFDVVAYKSFEATPGWSNNTTQVETPIIQVTAGDTFDLVIAANSASVNGLRTSDLSWFSIIDESDNKGLFLYRTTNVTVGSLVTAIRSIPFNAVAYDDSIDGCWNISNPSKIVIPAGITGVRVSGATLVTPVSGETYYVNHYLYKNAVTVVGQGGFSYLDHGNEAYSPDHWIYRYAIIPVEEGDELECLVFCTQGNFNTLAAKTYLQVEFLTSQEIVDLTPRGDFVLASTAVAGYAVTGTNQVSNVSAGSNRGEHHQFSKMTHPESPPFYFEMEIVNKVGPNDGYAGIAAFGHGPTNYGTGWRANGTLWSGGVQRVTGLPTWTTGDVLMFWYNPPSGGLWIGKNGVWNKTPGVDASNLNIDVLYDYIAYVVTPSFTLRDQGDVIKVRDGVIVPCIYEASRRKYGALPMNQGDSAGLRPTGRNPYDFYLDGRAYADGASSIYEITTQRAVTNNGVTVTSGQMVFTGASGVNIALPTAQGHLLASNFDLYVKMTPDVITGFKGIVTKWDESTNNRSWSLRSNGSTLEFYGSTDGVTPVLIHSQAAALAVGVPIEIQVRRRGITMQLVINGAIVSTYNIGTASFHSALSTTPFIGSYGTGTEFDGNIEYVGLEIY